VLGPTLARLADRTGPVRALRLTAVVHPALLVVVVLAAHSDLPLLVLLLPTVLAGATVPPHGPGHAGAVGARAARPALATAYSLESVVVELCFVLGPLLVASLTRRSGPSAPVLAAGAWPASARSGCRRRRACGGPAAAERHGSRFGPLSSPGRAGAAAHRRGVGATLRRGRGGGAGVRRGAGRAGLVGGRAARGVVARARSSAGWCTAG
jgi:hypothetical protein